MLDMKFYKEQGYNIAKNIIPDDVIQNFLQEVQHVLANTLRNKNIAVSDDLYENLQKLHRYDTDLYLTSVRLMSSFISFTKNTLSR